mmetsp:Transcript_28974/g.47605  ORF Transcript_28974/g.47605 Transcript_28974/m.47605 type:complete len:364 (-) Transcript_28974:302-1393(-)
MYHALPVFESTLSRTRAMADNNEDLDGIKQQDGPVFDQNHAAQWLKSFTLHLVKMGYYRIATGEETAVAGNENAARSFRNKQDRFCGMLLTALGSSDTVVLGQRPVDRFDPVALWTAVTAYVNEQAGSGSETANDLTELLLTKYEPGTGSDVHAHFATLLEVRNRIVDNDAAIVFHEKLMMAIVLVSLPRGPDSYFEPVIISLLMELSKPGGTVTLAFVIAQLEQCERDHRRRDTDAAGATALMARGRYQRGRAPTGRRPQDRFPTGCNYCSDPLHDIVQCDRLLRRMLDARSLIVRDDRKQRAMLAGAEEGDDTDDEERPATGAALLSVPEPPVQPPPLPAKVSVKADTYFKKNLVPSKDFW